MQANGCRVIGIDFDEEKVQLAREKNIIGINPTKGTDPVKYVLEETASYGADAILITASTKTDEVIHQAAEMSRKKGRIVLVGVIGLGLRRDDFYKKELSFQVSCSYGPGRYDDDYENRGIDYPLPFVRWTEKRNFETVLQAIAMGRIDVKSLITEEVKLDNYKEIYGDMRKHGSIASIIKYPSDSKMRTVVEVTSLNFTGTKGQIGIIGAGNFTSATMLPALTKSKACIRYIASAQGLSAKILAKKVGAKRATSDYHEILKDDVVDLVMITTRHNLHAPMVLDALYAGKHVFVEKPLCLNQKELGEIVTAYQMAQKNGVTLTVGFNRRFSSFAVKMKELAGKGVKNIIATMNAGFIPSEVWVHDLKTGGGRIIGEACHFIDLCSFLTDSIVTSVCMNAMGENPEENTDNASILLRYKDGSNAVINYFANGSKSYSKERVEIYTQEKTLVLDNWRELKGYGCKGFTKMKKSMDKGHTTQFSLLNERILRGGEALIPFCSIINTTKASFACIESLKLNKWIEIEP